MNLETLLFSKKGNAHYIKRYLRFIDTRIQKLNGEKHHILPKAKDMFPEFKDLTKNPWNGIILSSREHFIAHYMLARAFPNSESQSYCCWKFFKNKKTQNSRQYEIINEQKKRNHSNRMRGEKNPFYGKKHSEETRRNCGVSKFTEEEKQIVSEKRKKTIQSWDSNQKEKQLERSSIAGKKCHEKHPEQKYAFNIWHNNLSEIELKRVKEKRKESQKIAWENKPFLFCHHCGHRTKHPGNLRRYHLDNCKSFKEII